jgi:hypothetical protein
VAPTNGIARHRDVTITAHGPPARRPTLMPTHLRAHLHPTGTLYFASGKVP